MAYNFLDLVNEVNRRLNEVELTSVNFASATTNVVVYLYKRATGGTETFIVSGNTSNITSR